MDGSFGSLTGVVSGFLNGGSFDHLTTAPTRVPDGCLVPTAPLADVVRGFMHNWNSERPQKGGRFHAEDVEELSPVRAAEWLSSASGVPEATITRIVGRRSKGTELRIADAIVSALDRPDLFYDGHPPTLPVYPNPSAPAEARASCCGGSLTGVASASW